MTKFCHGCDSQKDKSEFGRDTYRGDGFTSRCRDCRNKAGIEWRKKNPEIVRKINDSKKETRKEYYARPEIQLKYKNESLKRAFGISIDQFNVMLKK